MIPAFDENGNLPPGVHRCTLEELTRRFGHGSEERIVETTESVQFIEWARQAGIKRMLVDGSYTTSKKAPNDVDVVILRGNASPSTTGSVPDVSTQWPFIHVMSAADDADLEKWACEDFGKDRHGNVRGILEIEL